MIPIGTVDEASRGWDKQEPVITICRSGRRSGRVAKDLEKLGFKRIASMRGGMLAWNNGRPAGATESRDALPKP